MKYAGVLAAVVLVFSWVAPVWSHCQIPCGIYGDELRFQMIEEDLATIEKSMAEIEAKDTSMNQIVRWVGNKEDHCQKVQDIVTAYFLAQRIKPVDDGPGRADYLKSLELLHRMHVEAMKAKQGTDLQHVTKLRELTGKFQTLYFKHHDHH